jgi:hypothetical protein
MLTEGFIPTEGFGPILERLMRDSDRYFGASTIAIEPLARFQRRRSELLKVRIRAGSGAIYAFVKRYRLESTDPAERIFVTARVETDFAVTQRIHRLVAGRDGLHSVRPIACFPDELAVITEEAPGELLGRVLKRSAWLSGGRTLDNLCIALERVGHWLKAVQAMDGPPGRFSLDGMRAYLDIRLMRLREVRAMSAEERQVILDYFDEQRGHVAAADLVEVPIHGDLCPGNVLVSGSEITVLDLAMTRPGSMYTDLTHMYTHIESDRTKRWVSQQKVERLLQATLRGFDGSLSPSRPLFALNVLQHLICKVAKLATRPPKSRFDAAYKRYLRGQYHARVRTLVRSGMNLELNSLVTP